MTVWCGYVGHGAGLSEELPETVEGENVKTDAEPTYFEEKKKCGYFHCKCHIQR